MSQISYRGYRFPPDVIQRAVWLYLRFTLSLRDVEDILAERGIDVTYETIRCWVDRFGPLIADRIRTTRPRPTSKWHLDEMFVAIRGRQMYLWRAIDDEGEVLEVLLTSKRDKRAALRLMRKLLRKHGVSPTVIMTDRYRVYGAAFKDSELTTGSKVRTFRFDAGSESAKGSNLRGRRNVSCPCMLRPTIYLMWAVTLRPPGPTVCFGRPRWLPGVRPRRSHDSGRRMISRVANS